MSTFIGSLKDMRVPCLHGNVDENFYTCQIKTITKSMTTSKLTEYYEVKSNLQKLKSTSKERTTSKRLYIIENKNLNEKNILRRS